MVALMDNLMVAGKVDTMVVQKDLTMAEMMAATTGAMWVELKASKMVVSMVESKDLKKVGMMVAEMVAVTVDQTVLK